MKVWTRTWETAKGNGTCHGRRSFAPTPQNASHAAVGIGPEGVESLPTDAEPYGSDDEPYGSDDEPYGSDDEFEADVFWEFQEWWGEWLLVHVPWQHVLEEAYHDRRIEITMEWDQSISYDFNFIDMEQHTYRPRQGRVRRTNTRPLRRRVCLKRRPQKKTSTTVATADSASVVRVSAFATVVQQAAGHQLQVAQQEVTTFGHEESRKLRWFWTLLAMLPLIAAFWLGCR